MSRQDSLRETLARLRTPISDEDTLVSVLVTGLELLGLQSQFPPKTRDDAASPLDAKSFLRFIPEYQTALLANVLPHWLAHLHDAGHIPVLKMYFMPKLAAGSIPFLHSPLSWNFLVMECIISAHGTLITEPISQFAVDILSTICRIHSPLDVFCYIFKSDHDPSGRENAERWSDYLRSLFAIFGRVSNASMGGAITVPKNLDTGVFLANLCHSFYSLMHNSMYQDQNVTHQEAAALFLNRLVTAGAFPSSQPMFPSVTSFWALSLPKLRAKVASPETPSEPSFSRRFRPTLFNLPLSSQLTVSSSLLSHLDLTDESHADVGVGGEQEKRCVVKREALLVNAILGDMLEDKSTITSPDGGPVWSLVSALLNRQFTEAVARVIVCWSARSYHPSLALKQLLDRSVELWSDQDHIRHSSLKRHRAITTLILATVAELSSNGAMTSKDSTRNTDAAVLPRLAKNGSFIAAVGVYIAHADPSVRRCGMLVAEIVARRTGGKLEFPGWEGDGDGREWAREMRTLVEAKDSAADINRLLGPEEHAIPDDASQQVAQSAQALRNITIVRNDEDSDDSLEGYDSPSSSRSSSPAPSIIVDAQTKAPSSKSNLEPTVEEINDDPTLLNLSRKKIQKPVYLLDLGKLFKVDKEGDEQCESIRMALQTAAELIRRKADWGLELEENAVDLTYSLIGLQNNYDIEDFNRLVLEAVTALVVCCPRKAAPCIIEHFFTPNFSTSHRFMMLNALALGARELAGLPTQIAAPKALFPSKMLPSSQHQKYLTLEDEVNAGAQIRGMVATISSQAIEAGRADAEAKVPEIVREKQLTVSKSYATKRGGIVEVNERKGFSNQPTNDTTRKPPTRFNDVAADYFIIPLITKFWDHLNNALGREEKALRSSRTGGYRATGTAMILSPLVLSHLVNTISVMVHASRHSPAFLSVISPAALELAVTLGTRRLGAESVSTTDEESKKAASVLSSSLELAIVVLDACIDLDRGRTLAMDHANLISGVDMWARKAFGTLEKGLSLEGMGGEEEMRLRRASAGLILKLEEISGRWGQTMLLAY